MIHSRVWLLGISLLVLVSCTKDEEETTDELPTVEISVGVSHEVDGASLVFNEIRYANKAGNPWGVTRYEYYLSDFAFQKSNGDWYKPSFAPVLINGQDPTTHSFVIPNVKQGEYTGFSFMVGVYEEMNYTGSLENNLANLNMAWPPSLNGGYHHLKFEGNYVDDMSDTAGFTVHMGNIGMQSVNEFLNTPMSINSSSTNDITLTMNLNEWFDNPHLYDFNIDGNYTMAIDSLMEKVSDNGQNCFKTSIVL